MFCLTFQGSEHVLQTPASKTSSGKPLQAYSETPRQSNLAPTRAEIFETPRYTSTTRPAPLETPRGSNLAPTRSEIVDTPRYSNLAPSRPEMVDTPRYSKPTPARTEVDGNYPRYSAMGVPDPAPIPTPTPMSRSISLPARDNDRYSLQHIALSQVRFTAYCSVLGTVYNIKLVIKKVLFFSIRAVEH